MEAAGPDGFGRAQADRRKLRTATASDRRALRTSILESVMTARVEPFARKNSTSSPSVPS